MGLLELDPRAQEAIDRRAEALLAHVVPTSVTPSSGWAPDIAAQVSLTSADLVGDVLGGKQGRDGRYISLEFAHQGQLHQLEADHYKDLVAIIPMVLKAPSFRRYTSEQTVEDELRRWVCERCKGVSQSAFSSQFIEACECTIEDYEVWVPIEGLHVQEPIELGPLRIIEVSQEIVTAVMQRVNSDKYLRYCGHAAVVVMAKGDQNRARQVGRLAAERAIAALSLCFFTAHFSNVASSAAPWGTRNARPSTEFFFCESKFAGAFHGVVGAAPKSEMIDSARLRSLEPLLKPLGVLLALAPDNALPATVLDALLVYQRSLRTADPAEKLIFIFVSLEMILVRNGTEPLQDNVATRIAFLIGSSADERRSVIEVVKAGYGLRSRFIHHGARVSEVDDADRLLNIAWRALIELVIRAPNYKDRDALIQALEDRKLQ